MSRTPQANHGVARKGAFVIALSLCAYAAVGISGADESAMRAFEESARQWQTSPEFRWISTDYCIRGSRALRTLPFRVPGRSLVVAVRSLPFLPQRFAINSTSRAHYENFSKGPLSAYLHLCGEQSVPEFANVLESAGAGAEPARADLRRFLDSFHMDGPVCSDDGALESVATLLRDTEPRRPLTVRHNIGPLLVPHIRTIALQLDVPEEASAMSPEQQLAVLERLDAHVRRHDPELWRTKQLSDFCGGVWAQVFGTSYGLVIWPLIFLHRSGLVLLVVLLVRAALRAGRRGGTTAHVVTSD